MKLATVSTRGRTFSIVDGTMSRDDIWSGKKMARREFEGLWRLVFFNSFGSSRIPRAVAAEKLGRRRARVRGHLGCYSNKNNLQIDANESLLHLENVIRRQR